MDPIGVQASDVCKGSTVMNWPGILGMGASVGGLEAAAHNPTGSASIVTLFVDRELRVRHFTPGAVELLGLSPGDNGRCISDLPRFVEGDLAADVQEVMRTREIRQRQVRLAGARAWFMEWLMPLHAADDKVDGVVATFMGITPIKQPEEPARDAAVLVREFLDALPVLAWTARPDGQVVFFNKQVQQHPTFHPREDGTWDWISAIHPDDRPGALEAWQKAMETGEMYQRELRVGLSEGQWRWYLCRAVPVRDEQGRILSWHGTATDIQELRDAQEELAATKLSAEAAQAAAECANKAKDEFLAVLSHELRNPLNPVLATASMLRDDLHFDADTRAQLEIICRNAELEARLIDDLLDVTRISKGKVELDRRPVALGTVLARAAEVCRPDIAARRMEFGIDLGTSRYLIEADAARLQQVFWNLLNNAIKFTPEGGRVSIRCHSDGNGHVIAEVTDNGKGIDPKLLPRLFNAFEQGERHTTRQFGGLGLGLAISKTLVELHGGTLTASSKGVGQGATFTVTLPQLPAEAAAEVTEKPPEAPQSAVRPRVLRILLVEDHGDTAAVMIRLLSGRGHKVKLASDVASALRCVQEHEFDLLLSDLGLPDGSGLDLMRALRASGLKLPGFALSGYGQEADVRASREAGFTEHLTKPVSLFRLEEAIGRAFGGGPRIGAEQAGERGARRRS